MLNHITIMGRLTKDVELRRTNTGTPVSSFTIACDRDFGDKETDFIECVAWKKTAEFASKYFSKGKLAIVSGRLQIRYWKDKDGNNRKTAEIVVDDMYFGESKGDSKKEDDHFANALNQPSQDYGLLDGDDHALPF